MKLIADSTAYGILHATAGLCVVASIGFAYDAYKTHKQAKQK